MDFQSRSLNFVPDMLTEKLNKGFVKPTQWSPAFPNCNPLYYHFWDKMKIKVYGDRFNEAFAMEKELKVWPEVSNVFKEI